MAEKLATALQIQTLDDITRTLVKGAPLSPHVNGYENERHCVYGTSKPMGQSVVDEMHMAKYIAEAADTSWEVQIGVSNQESNPNLGDIEYLLRCITNRPSGLRVERHNWLYLNTATSGYTLVREQDAASIAFTEAGLREFDTAYRTGYSSEITRDYIDKIIQTDPDYAAIIGGYISQACGVLEQVDIAPEAPKEPFVAHRAETVTSGFCTDFSAFIGSLTLFDQVARGQK